MKMYIVVPQTKKEKYVLKAVLLSLS